MLVRMSGHGFETHPLAGHMGVQPRYGYHLVLDIEDCDPRKIDDARAIRSWLRGCGVDEVGGLVEHIGMVAHGDPIIESFAHDNPVTAGYTAVQLIETSSITAHFSPHLRTAHIDVFSCRAFDPVAVIDFTVKVFGTADSHGRATFLPRG
jgi:S-adenosylmethionine/arginine decarboxylase-like enzyme